MWTTLRTGRSISLRGGFVPRRWRRVHIGGGLCSALGRHALRTRLCISLNTLWSGVFFIKTLLRRLRDKGALEGVIKIKIKKSSEHCSCVSGGPPGNTIKSTKADKRRGNPDRGDCATKAP